MPTRTTIGRLSHTIPRAPATVSENPNFLEIGIGLLLRSEKRRIGCMDGRQNLSQPFACSFVDLFGLVIQVSLEESQIVRRREQDSR